MTDAHTAKTILIAFHASLYQAAKSRQRYVREINARHPQCDQDKDYLFLIDETLSRLSVEEQSVLRNDFLSPLSKNWWMEFYSKSTYYRLRHLAVDRFLHCLHHEKMV